MRHLIVQVPAGRGDAVLAAAKRFHGANVVRLESRPGTGTEPADVILVEVPNKAVEGLLDAVEDVPGLRVTLFPTGVLALQPPPAEAPDQVVDVDPRSPIEIFLGGLQSIGSWTGFLAYAAAAGAVAWIGLTTGTVYLLTGAMLIAPYAGPAMNAALATARGDAVLLRRSLLRYAAGLATTIVVAGLLSLAWGPEIATGQMVDVSLVSSVAVLLPLVAGAAGALHLCQSERNSLVSGAATGVLVAASLAPPAALVGMAAAIGEWQMVEAAAFQLLLQFTGINLSGTVVFHLYGVTPRGARYDRGRHGIGWGAWLASAAAVGLLLAWQFAQPPALQQATRAVQAEALVREVVESSGLARVIDSEVRFPRAGLSPPALLVLLYVQPQAAGDAAVEDRLRRAVRARLAAALAVTPLVEVTVIEE